MIIIHVMEPSLPRLVADSLENRLRVMPAVIVTGPPDWKEYSGARAYIGAPAISLLGRPGRTGRGTPGPRGPSGGNWPVTIDEVQREPSLLLAVKRAIDQQR